MSDFQAIEGHCQCGAVRYRVTAPAEHLFHCHCAMCRRVHGTVFATFAAVAREHLAILAGAEMLATFESSPGMRRQHCRRCGCELFIEAAAHPRFIWYTPGTADGHSGHPADGARHIFVGSKVSWHEITDGLPQFDENPPAT